MKKFIAVLLTFCIIASLNLISVFAVTPLPSMDKSHLMQISNEKIEQNGRAIGQNDKLTDTNTTPPSPVNIAFNFKVPVLGDGVPDYVSHNDTATIPLATGFLLPDSVGPFDLNHGGKKVGELTLLKNNTSVDASIVFNGDADVFGNGYSDVNCFLSVALLFDNSGNNGADGDHSVKILGKDYTLNIPSIPTSVTALKSGTINGQFIDWRVMVDATKGGVGADLDGYKFIDNIATVGAYVPDSFKISVDDNINNAVAPAVGFANTNDVLEYTFEANTIGPRYIFFSTKINDDVFFTSTQQTIENTAQIVKGTDSISSNKANVSFKNTWIEKAETQINHETGEITWTITANTSSATLNNTVITDILDTTKVEWVSAEWFKKTGVAWETSGTPITPIDSKYSLGTINTPVRLVINAKIISTLDLAHTVQTVANTATLQWDKDPSIGGTHSIASNTVKSEIGLNPIRKKSGADYNTSTHEATWNVTVGKSDINDDLRIVDLLVYSSASFDKNANYDISNNTGSLLTQISPTALLTLTPSYNQKYVADSFTPTNSSGLDITVHTVRLNGKAVADLLVVTGTNGLAIDVNGGDKTFTYKTIATNPDIYLSNVDNGNSIKSLSNTATLLSNDVLINAHTAKVNCPNNTIDKDTLSVVDAQKALTDPANVNATVAASDKSFNYIDKSVVFRLHINASGAKIVGGLTAIDGTPLGNATITDVLPLGWEFVDIANGVKFYAFEGIGNGKKVTARTYLPSPSFITADFSNVGSTTLAATASLTFTSLDKPYVILLRARPTAATAKDLFSVNATLPSVANNANLEVANWAGKANDYEDISFKSQMLSKTKSASVNGALTWTIDYNPYAIAHDNAALMDTIPHGIDLRTDAMGMLDLNASGITMHELVLNADGSISLGNAVTNIASYIYYDPATRVLKIDMPDESKSYRTSYITDITGSTGAKPTNHVVLANGHNSSTSSSAVHNISSSDVSATMTRSGWITITKKDRSNNNLAGAEFTILTVDGKTTLRKGTTDANGSLTLRGLPEGSYILKETVAPANFSLSNKVYQVKVVKNGNSITTTIDGASTNLIDIVNYPVGTVGALLITNALQGNAVDPQKEFEFEVTVAGADGDYPYVKNGTNGGVITFKNGRARFTLKGNETFEILDLPKNASYTISETDYTSEGYATTKPVSSGTIAADATSSVAFVFIKNADPSSSSSTPTTATVSPPLSSTPKTGQTSFTFIWVIVLLLSSIGLIFIICEACRKNKRK